jgi:hypothetical protein
MNFLKNRSKYNQFFLSYIYKIKNLIFQKIQFYPDAQDNNSEAQNYDYEDEKKYNPDTLPNDRKAKTQVEGAKYAQRTLATNRDTNIASGRNSNQSTPSKSDSHRKQVLMAMTSRVLNSKEN